MDKYLKTTFIGCNDNICIGFFFISVLHKNFLKILVSDLYYKVFWIANLMKNRQSWSLKRCWRYIILHMCTKTHNHIRYSSWDTKWVNFFCHVWAIFAFFPRPPPPPLTTQLSSNDDKKSIWRCHPFSLVQQKQDEMMYAYSNMECDRHNFLSF